MAEPEIIQQERQLLREYRNARADYKKAQSDANTDFENQKVLAGTARDDILQFANAELAKVRMLVGEIQGTLRGGGWRSITDNMIVSPFRQSESSDPRKSFHDSVVKAEKVADATKSVSEGHDRDIVAIVFGSGLVIGLGIFVVVFLLFLQIFSNPFFSGSWGFALIFGILLPSLGLGIGIQLLRNNRLKAKIAISYQELLKAASEVEFWHTSLLKKTEQSYQTKIESAQRNFQESMSAASTTYRAKFQEINQRQSEITELGEKLSPSWRTLKSEKLVVSTDIPTVTRIGTLRKADAWESANRSLRRGVQVEVIGDSTSRMSQITARPTYEEIVPGPLLLPAFVAFPNNQGLFLKTIESIGTKTVGITQSFLLRLLTSIPPGKLRFTFTDPVGLGQNVAPFMHLADYDEQLVTGKAWTEPNHIEQRLADLTEHMENVIQKYLRNQFATIEEYNQDAGEVAEAYRVLVVMDFPANFSETAARRLVSIAQNGPRCGVYAIVLADTSKQLPYNFNIADLERASTVIAWDSSQNRFVWQDEDFKDCLLELDAPPDAELFNRIADTVGKKAILADKVEVSFEKTYNLFEAQRRANPELYPSLPQTIDPANETTWWTGNSSRELIAPLGRLGAKKAQCFRLGQGTNHSALLAGRVGSGKSNLLHTLVMSLALNYSPDELQLYLVDLKEVEFKVYATHRLPHAQVVAIRAEREYSLSVLEKLDAELEFRMKLFNAVGPNTNRIDKYRDKSGRALPRILLIVDEFQELFTDDDAIASKSTRLLDRLVRQGRAFGINVLLASQTLAGAYTINRSTMGQMAVRIALQSNEADSRLILAEDNAEARLLSRPGDAIYNANDGIVGSNDRFQVAILTDEQRTHNLNQISDLARQRGYAASPIIFDGDEFSVIQDNQELRKQLAAYPPSQIPQSPIAYLGEPIAIRPPIAATFRRQSGSNLLIIGQSDEAALGMLSAALISLAAQSPISNLNLLDFGAVDGPNANFFQRLNENLGTAINIGRRRELPTLLDQLAQETQRRIDGEAGGAPIYLFVYGLQRARDLRQEDTMSFSMDANPSNAPNPAQQFNTILREGPDVGIFTIVWCDTLTNLNRALDRRALREFAMRVVMQMSAEDSANLIDTPAASKLGPYRALFYSEEEGRLEKFRPYALPPETWLEWVKQQLERKRITTVQGESQ